MGTAVSKMGHRLAERAGLFLVPRETRRRSEAGPSQEINPGAFPGGNWPQRSRPGQPRFLPLLPAEGDFAVTLPRRGQLGALALVAEIYLEANERAPRTPFMLQLGNWGQGSEVAGQSLLPTDSPNDQPFLHCQRTPSDTNYLKFSGRKATSPLRLNN